MSRKKKNGNQDRMPQIIFLITATIQLITALVGLISKLME